MFMLHFSMDPATSPIDVPDADIEWPNSNQKWSGALRPSRWLFGLHQAREQIVEVCYLSRVSGIHFQMLERDDRVTLKEYGEHGSEEAFAALVARRCCMQVGKVWLTTSASSNHAGSPATGGLSR
jgi:hypothetical protein